jgi:hypothetical protein
MSSLKRLEDFGEYLFSYCDLCSYETFSVSPFSEPGGLLYIKKLDLLMLHFHFDVLEGCQDVFIQTFDYNIQLIDDN